MKARLMAMLRVCCGLVVGAICGALMELIVSPLFGFLFRILFHSHYVFHFPYEGLIFGGIAGGILWGKRASRRQAVLIGGLVFLSVVFLICLIDWIARPSRWWNFITSMFFVYGPHYLLHGILTGYLAHNIYERVEEYFEYYPMPKFKPSDSFSSNRRYHI